MESAFPGKRHRFQWKKISRLLNSAGCSIGGTWSQIRNGVYKRSIYHSEGVRAGCPTPNWRPIWEARVNEEVHSTSTMSLLFYERSEMLSFGYQPQVKDNQCPLCSMRVTKDTAHIISICPILEISEGTSFVIKRCFKIKNTNSERTLLKYY